MFSGVLVAHVFVTLPYVVRAVAPILAEVDIRQEEVARAMGANGVQLFTGVILPAIRSGLISGSAFTFVRSVGELGATIMVLGSLAPRTQTAPTFILSALSQGGTEEAAAMAVLLVMISLALFLGLKLSVTAAERRERRWSAR
jgi:sulfate transport system permease protein